MKKVAITLGIFIFSYSFCQAESIQIQSSAEEIKAKSYWTEDVAGQYLDDYKKDRDTTASQQDGICRPGKTVNQFPFYIYKDADYQGNHFRPTGHMGDYLDIKIDTYHRDNPQSGETCIKMTYTGKAYQGGKWAGLYWQHPANNWGSQHGGFDLSKATKLTFWARGEKGNEIITTFKMGEITGQYGDSGGASIGPIELTKKWKKYTISLRNIFGQTEDSCPSLKPASRIIGGFAWSTNIDVNHGGAVFYLDEIKYERD